MATRPIAKLANWVEDLSVPGLAALVLLPVLIPVAGRALKPAAKAAIKGGLTLYEKSQGVVAEVGETLEDWVAEAKAELAEAREQDFDTASALPEAPPTQEG